MSGISKPGRVGTCLLGLIVIAGCKTMGDSEPMSRPQVARAPSRSRPASERQVARSGQSQTACQSCSSYAVATKTPAVTPTQRLQPAATPAASEVKQVSYTRKETVEPHKAEAAVTPPIEEKSAVVSADGKTDGMPALADLPTSGLAHAEDYAWICGQVQYSRLSGGWSLRYSSLGDEDPFGGSVVLVENRDLDHLTDGQFVIVRGHVANPEGKNTPHAYRVDAFRVLERNE